MAKKLSLRQEGFVKKYIENNGNGTQAALEVYNVKNDNSAAVTASRLLRNVNIQQRIRESLQATGLTPESISEYLKKAIVSGLGERATNADSLRGLDLYAKLTGAYDRQDVEQSYKITLSKLNSKELKMELEKITKQSASLINDINNM